MSETGENQYLQGIHMVQSRRSLLSFAQPLRYFNPVGKRSNTRYSCWRPALP